MTYNTVLKKLTSRFWRMNNLYYIRDKTAKTIKFKMNKAQLTVAVHKHNRKIILKSRQQGISTYHLLLGLDYCLTIPGYQAGIQSYGEDESKKLARRALFAWNMLDNNVKELLGLMTIGEPLKLITKNSKEFEWNNGATLKIGNFRGDTLQFLHVSELGKIAKKYPEKAKELKTGAFQAVATQNKITIESTAEGNSGLFYEMWKKAEELKMLNKPLTPLDFEAIFLSWVDDPDCNLNMEVEIPKDLTEYFKELEIKGIVLTNTQKWWYAKKYEELGDDIKREYPTTPDEAFEVSTEGSYYAHYYRKYIVKNKKIVSNLYDKNLPVYVAIDLGMNDMMVLIFFQIWENQLRIIDVYANYGESIKHYVDIMKNKPYNIKMTYLPHDAKVRDLSTGKTRYQIFRELGVVCKVLDKVSLEDGIALVREWIPHMWIDSKLKVIRDTFINYRKEWDEKLGTWKSKPVHDEWSHYADAIRYMCIALGSPRRYEPKYKQEETKITGYAV